MTQPPARTVRLAFVGDISAVANEIPPVSDTAIAAILVSADLIVGNCESPVVERVRAVLGTKIGTHHAMTERFLADTLDAIGVSRDKLVLSAANNHMLDQGIEGFNETMAALRRLGIRTIGTVEGGPVAKVNVGSLIVGLAAFTLWRNADAGRFGARISMESDPAKWLRGAADGADLLCAIPHWDWEFRHFPRAETRALARQLSDHGVGLIVGHHAHVVQAVEHVGGTLVAYGLGDFLGTAFVRQPWPGRIGTMLTVEVSADAETRGTVASYQMHFFMRLRDGGREKLVPVEALEASLKTKVEGRLGVIFGA